MWNLDEEQYRFKKKAFLEMISGLAMQDVVVAFSGGVDSSLLIKALCDATGKTSKNVYGIFIHTMLQPLKEIDTAKKIAEESGAIFRVIEIDELKQAEIEDNPPDRCYRCKRYLFQELRREARELGAERILEGTNADDLTVYRPGIRAVQELGILSPLAEAGLRKEDVRRLAKEYGISVAQKPSTPCLATRFPYGTRLTYEGMRKAEQAEEYLKSLGLYNVRARVYGETVRIEVDLEDLAVVLEQREKIVRYLKSLGYVYITLDLEGFRSGSMDQTIDLD